MRVGVAALLGCLLVQAPSVATDRAASKTDNVSLLKAFDFGGGDKQFEGGTDIAFSGRYAYVGQMGKKGGVHVFDLSGRVPRKVGFLSCPGGQNDVAVVRPGLLALGYESAGANGVNGCGSVDGGMTLIDVSNPRRPRTLGAVAVPEGAAGVHTLRAFPGKTLVYLSPGYWDQEASAEKTLELIVDVSNPRRPRIVSTFDPVAGGCHDLSFHVDGEEALAFCAGDSHTQIWDVSDPLKPSALSAIVNPLMPSPVAMNHSAEASSDGKYLVIGDEAGITECSGGPTGSLWIYDISEPQAPVPAGHYDIPRGPLPSDDVAGYTCTAHNFAFVPGTHTLVAAWYRAGMNVIDLSNPAVPKEVAHYMPKKGSYWSAYPHRGRIYASGLPGLEVFTVKGLGRGR